MSEVTRRHALQAGVGLGFTAAAVPASADDKISTLNAEQRKIERERVIEVGMTPEEADCWLVTADAAGLFFALPKLHPMDAQEVASAIHIIQNKLLSRPTYRRYLEKAGAPKK